MTRDELRDTLLRQAETLLERLVAGETLDPGVLVLFVRAMDALEALESFEARANSSN